MPSAVKVAISLPEALYQAVEAKRDERREGRSEFFQRAVGAFLRSLEEQEAVERYIRGYRDQPETDEDVRLVAGASNAALAAEPWE
jgi:metal-responsive CopG/Arc/MetJ family transcriptional regulator